MTLTTCSSQTTFDTVLDVVRLDAILVEAGDNGARVYAENQAKMCASMGIEYRLHRIAPSEHGSVFDDIAGRVLLLSNEFQFTE